MPRFSPVVRVGAGLFLSTGMLFLSACTSDQLAARDDEARTKVHRLSVRLSNVEQKLLRQTKNIESMARKLEISVAQITAMKKQAELAQQKEMEALKAKEQEAKVAADAGGPSTIAYDKFTLKVQRALKRAGFDPGPVDGKKGPNTTSALQAFQKENSIPTTGMADEATWAILKRYQD